MTNPNGNPGDDQPYEANPYEATQLGQPQYGETPQYGQAPQYGETPQYGQPDYGQQPQYGAQFAQPQYGQPSQFGGAPGMPPDDNLVWAILSTVLCCLPLGVVSIIKSTSVSKLWAAGDYVGAQQAADDAKKFAVWSAIASVAVSVIVVIVYIILGAALFATSG